MRLLLGKTFIKYSNFMSLSDYSLLGKNILFRSSFQKTKSPVRVLKTMFRFIGNTGL